MKVSLINLPDLHSLDPKLDAPLGLMYISSYLKSKGIDAQVLDLSLTPINQWRSVIKEAKIFGITINSATLPLARNVAKYISSTFPEAIIVAGGPHPTVKPLSLIMHGFDHIVIGEGESAMLKICKGETNEIIVESEPLHINDIPFPDRNSETIRLYTRTVDGIPSCSLITSRGCPYGCVFCSSHLMWNKIRYRSPESVIEELKVIKNHYGFKAVHFWDDTFTLHRRRLIKMLDGIKDLGLIFRCNGNLRKDGPAIHQRLYDSGCREYCVGVESGSQKILNILNKGTSVEKNKKCIQSAINAGLIVKAYLMVGSPGETWETVEETRKFIEEVQPHQWTLFNFVPMPGCDVYEHPEKYKIKLDDVKWENFFCIGGDNVGGLTHATERMSKEDIAEARKYLLDHLPKQKGKLQKYYERVK